MGESTRQYFMSVDGGGSKLSVVLFDDDLKIVGCGLSGAINPRFVSGQMIRENFADGITDCLKNVDLDCIEKLYISMPGPADLFAAMLSRKVSLGQIQILSEGENSLLGGIFDRRGVVALSGTGSNIFNINGALSTGLGGWGALFGDEGSGYSIGRDALNAAVKTYEKRGPATILPTMIVENWHLTRLSDVIDFVYSSKDYRGLIASITRLVVDCADDDRTCRDILIKAGIEMAQQVIALFERDKIPLETPIMVAGSVWKNNPYMFKAFYTAVTNKIRVGSIHFPWFEPVIGGAIAYVYERYEALDECLKNKVNDSFQAFRYNVGPPHLLANDSVYRSVMIGPPMVCSGA